MILSTTYSGSLNKLLRSHKWLHQTSQITVSFCFRQTTQPTASLCSRPIKLQTQFVDNTNICWRPYTSCYMIFSVQPMWEYPSINSYALELVNYCTYSFVIVNTLVAEEALKSRAKYTLLMNFYH